MSVVTRVAGTWFGCSTMACCLLLSVVSANGSSSPALRTYSIRKSRIFVAGVSSGGAMAMQLDVAYSATFRGAAIYAGLPYDCAQGDRNRIAGCSSAVPPIKVERLAAITNSWAKEGLIDPVENLKNQSVYLWSGLADVIINQAAVNAIEEFYRNYSARVFQYDKNFTAGHGWESPEGPVLCSVPLWPFTQSPFINICYDLNQVPPPFDWIPQIYDSEQIWLRQWFGPLRSKGGEPLKGEVLTFNQNEFAPGGTAASISMAGTGYVFVPQSCGRAATCGLVVALHGCLQHYAAIGRAFIDDAGINEWADTNNIVVLYPQTIASANNNWLGCWDWWGYLNHDRDYAQKSGAQMRAIYQMVTRVTGGSTAMQDPSLAPRQGCAMHSSAVQNHLR